jgi:hypothetical protein
MWIGRLLRLARLRVSGRSRESGYREDPAGEAEHQDLANDFSGRLKAIALLRVKWLDQSTACANPGFTGFRASSENGRSDEQSATRNKTGKTHFVFYL